MRRLALCSMAAALAAPLWATSLAAQGSLSLQGFGYPTGQTSTRAAATAGALGEFDAGSPINPGALPGAGRSIMAFQLDPEFRNVVVDGRSVKTTTARFPLVTVGARVGTRGFVGVTFSTLLDRTWDAAYHDTVSVGPDRAPSTVSTKNRGALSDARLAFAWQLTERVQVGVAFHALTGANRMTLERTFNDSSTFGTLQQNTTLAYTGSALSAGIVARLLPHVVAAGSLRMGGSMRTRLDDSLATQGNAPNRFGASLLYDGIPGSQLAVRYSHEGWTGMRGLGTAALDVHDANELSVGADVAGPRIRESTTQFRFGARTRELPFGWNGNAVKEQTLAAGGGMTFARGWATLDLSLQRAQRSAGIQREKGTILSVGLTVRP